jgi:hypothetical protein
MGEHQGTKANISKGKGNASRSETRNGEASLETLGSEARRRMESVLGWRGWLPSHSRRREESSRRMASRALPRIEAGHRFDIGRDNEASRWRGVGEDLYGVHCWTSVCAVCLNTMYPTLVLTDGREHPYARQGDLNKCHLNSNSEPGGGGTCHRKAATPSSMAMLSGPAVIVSRAAAAVVDTNFFCHRPTPRRVGRNGTVV